MVSLDEATESSPKCSEKDSRKAHFPYTMRFSVVCYAIVLVTFVLTGYVFLYTAKQPSQYLQEDLKVDQGKAPAEPAKQNVDMSVKEFVDSTIKNNQVVIW